MFTKKFAKNELSLNEILLEPKTGFRYFEMEKNSSYELDEEKYIHFVYILSGEVSLNRPQHANSVMTKKEFNYISDSKTIFLTRKKSSFILFSVNKYYCKLDPIFNKYITDILNGLEKNTLPLKAPKLLVKFFKDIVLVWGNKLGDPLLQEIKRRELVALLAHMYSKYEAEENQYDKWLCGELSLS